MNLPRLENKLVLVLPWLLFGFGIWVVFRSDSEVRIQFERAQDFWRSGDHAASVALYRRIAEHYPDSDLAPHALWEIGTIEYINLGQTDRASQSYRKIVGQYPNHKLASDSLRRLAEIQEVDFQDNEGALDYWKQLLRKSLEPGSRDETLFRLGNVWFNLGDLDRSQSVFDELVKSRSLTAYLRQQVTIRLGTILQLRQLYGEAIPYFEDALGAPDCDQCRLAAQLGLIESYEFLGELETALLVAANIDEGVYPSRSKQQLLVRLEQKQRFFDPTKWTGAK